MFPCRASFSVFFFWQTLYGSALVPQTSHFPLPSCYWGIFTHIETLLKHTQTYFGIFSTLYNPRIFTNLPYSELIAYLELEGSLKSCETFRHIQNPAIGHYTAIFMHIQNLVQCLHLQKPGILRIFEYSESFHNSIPTHIQNSRIFCHHIYENLWMFRTLTYLNLTHIQNSLKDLRWSFFCKNS